MEIKSLSLRRFRNYAALNIGFSPRVNLVYGENAQGKTNLLEAVCYLSGARSPRSRFDRELVSFGAADASMRAEIRSRDRDFLLEIALVPGRRRISVNGVAKHGGAALAEVFRTVYFCPEDLLLVRAGAAERRKFLDGALSQLRPRYAAALTEYNRLLEHKTRILRDWPEKPSLLDTLEEFDRRMAATGSGLIHYRARYVRQLSDAAAHFHADCSGGRERLDALYRTVSGVEDPFSPPEELFRLLTEHQARHRRAEREARSCLSGPHKDDLELLIDGKSARTFASQGQTRTAALALKLAERELSFADTGEYPVLLLDDVLSELDEKRQSYVLNQIRGGQVFISCCEEDRLAGLEEGAAFHIRSGAAV
jgi:DNA replication and repair protein RecF